MASSFVSGYHILSNFELLYFWTDLAEIWLRGHIPGADPESEVILYIRGQYQADIGHFLQFCLQKKRQALLNNRASMATIKVTDKQNLYF